MRELYYYEIWLNGNCIECSADYDIYFNTEDEAFEEGSWALFAWTDEEGYQDCLTEDFTVEVSSNLA